MEVLSLALLAVASGGLLLKARNNSKREGFSGSNNSNLPVFNNALFSQTVNKTPQSHLDYVNSTTQNYNPFAGIFNPLNVAPLDSSGNPPDNNKIKNTLRPYTTKTDSNNYYTYDSNTSDRLVAPYGVGSNSSGAGVNYCQNKKITMINNSVDCSAFSDSNFNQFCGIEHGMGTDSFQSNVNNSGLYIVSGLNSRNEQQIVQNTNDLRNSNRPSFINWQPTVGTALPNKFSVDATTCARINNDNRCTSGGAAGLGANNCVQCLPTQQYYYVNPEITKQPTILTLKGSGTCSVKLGSTSYVPSGSSSGTTFALTSNMQTITIPLDSSGNSSDEKTLTITITKSTNPIQLQGFFTGKVLSPTGNSVVDDIQDIAITAIDNSAHVLSHTVLYENDNPIILKPQTINGLVVNPLILSVPIPYCYIDPRSIEATYCSGPFIRTPVSASFLDTSNCFASGHNNPGTYTNTCLQGLFISGGCSSNGNGYPVNSNIAGSLLYNNGSPRTLGQISQYIISQFNQSYLGVDSNGNALDMSNWQNRVNYCIDSNETITNICDMLPSNIKENGPIPDECINYIFRDGSNDQNSFGTYDRSLYGKAKSLWSGNLKDRFCTSNGSMAPTISNLEQLKHINPDGTLNDNYVGINNIKQFYSNIHSQANNQSLTNAERTIAMQQCYGTEIFIQPSASITSNLGIESAQTNCGIKARYARLNGAPNMALQVSQLIVLDARGQNVALGKVTIGSALGNGNYSYAAPVDGTYQNRDAPIYKSAASGFSQSFQVDFGGVYDIVQVVYYNTTTTFDAASGAKLQLFDGNLQSIGTRQTLTSGLLQYFDFTSSNTPSYCPKTYEGTRGDLIDPALRIESSNASVTDYPVYEITNIWKKEVDDTNAVWIWNDPYASSSDLAETTEFYTTINNPGYIAISYTIFYRADDVITLTINNAPIVSSQTGTFWSEKPSSNIISILPGQNMIKASVVNNIYNNTYSAAGFIATFSNSNTSFYENPTNTTNWKSTNAPNNSFTKTDREYTVYNINKPRSWTATLINTGGAQWICNQPSAGVDSAAETIDFYLSITVTGTSIKNYTIYYTCPNEGTFTINNLQKSKTSGSVTDNTITSFQVVPGTNLIKASITSRGGPAGFVAIIQDDNWNYMYPTKAGGSWVLTTDTSYSTTNPCAYMSATDTGLETPCLGSIWASKCSGSYPSNDFSSFTMSGLGAELDKYWASRGASGANQTACKGKQVCNPGYKYNESTGRCERTTDSSTDTLNTGMRSCSEFNKGVACGETTNYQPDADGNCKWTSGTTRCHGSCANCADWVSHWRVGSDGDISAWQRVNACPSGYTNDKRNNMIIYSPTNGYQCSKTTCAEGTLQENGKCLSTQEPNF